MEFNIPTQEKIPPHLWGKSAWDFMDALVLTYPRENPPIARRNAMYNYFESLSELLPCPDCRHHYQEYLSKHPLHVALSSRKTLLDFYYDLRNEVNVRNTGRPVFRSVSDLWSQVLIKFQVVQNKVKRAMVAPLAVPSPMIGQHHNANPAMKQSLITSKRVGTAFRTSGGCNCSKRSG